MDETIGAEFQRQTRYERDEISRDDFGSREVPDASKDCGDLPRVELPRAVEAPDALFQDVLVKRRSVRQYAAQVVTVNQLAYLLWASNGVREVKGDHAFRTAPSAGALYPIETYVVVNNVDGIEQGVYYYSPLEHALVMLKSGDMRQQIAEAALGQRMCADAPVVFVWTAVFARSTWKYRQRAYRYIYLDAGHIAQNLALAAVALNMGTCQIGALFDDEVNAIVDADGESESVVYMSVVGTPAG